MSPEIKELSEYAINYLKSRGIDKRYVELFQLKEALYLGSKWIALKTVDGKYELRKIDGQGKRSPGGKNISIIDDGGSAHPKYYVCEGMISALSYAQMNSLTCKDLIIVLNSVGNKEKLLERLKEHDKCSITIPLIMINLAEKQLIT